MAPSSIPPSLEPGIGTSWYSFPWSLDLGVKYYRPTQLPGSIQHERLGTELDVDPKPILESSRGRHSIDTIQLYDTLKAI